MYTHKYWWNILGKMMVKCVEYLRIFFFLFFYYIIFTCLLHKLYNKNKYCMKNICTLFHSHAFFSSCVFSRCSFYHSYMRKTKITIEKWIWEFQRFFSFTYFLFFFWLASWVWIDVTIYMDVNRAFNFEWTMYLINR